MARIESQGEHHTVIQPNLCPVCEGRKQSGIVLAIVKFQGRTIQLAL